MGHVIVLEDRVFEELKQIALKAGAEQSPAPVNRILERMMDHPDVPMHYPYHHFIVPAAFLALYAADKGLSREELDVMLETAISRSKNILAGFCGSCGACGAGVGIGIFLSIATDTTTMSEESWQWANEGTGIGLAAVAAVPGPRCCKRTCFLAASAAVPYINEKLDTHFHIDEEIICKYSDRNKECKQSLCPFYSGGKEMKQV